MRNAFYARRGYAFKDKNLEKAFSFVWMNFSYKYNPDFKETLLTDINHYNIETIKKLESLRNGINSNSA
jgi:hypothetical protein